MVTTILLALAIEFMVACGRGMSRNRTQTWQLFSWPIPRRTARAQRTRARLHELHTCLVVDVAIVTVSSRRNVEDGQTSFLVKYGRAILCCALTLVLFAPRMPARLWLERLLSHDNLQIGHAYSAVYLWELWDVPAAMSRLLSL